MWSSIANLKENLNKIALDVHDDDVEDDLSVYNSHDPGVNPVSEGRISRNFSRSRSPPDHSPLANGFDSPYRMEIEQYKADIRRLKESEAEIKALSVNYAALLKEKEEKVTRLSEENNALKQNLHTANAALSGAKSTRKGNDDQSSSRTSKAMTKNRSFGSSMQNGNVHRQEGQINGIRGNEKELMELLDEKKRALAAMQASHKTEVKQLESELVRERDTMSSMKLRLEEEQKKIESFQHEMNLLKDNRDKLSSEMTLVRDELHQKIMEMQSLQSTLQRRNNDESIDIVENLRKRIADLEKENSLLKVEKHELMATAVSKSDNVAYKNLSGGNNAEIPLEGFVKKVEMEESLQKLEKELNETRQQRNKALHELSRLKQHLLDKEAEEAEKMDEDSTVIEELRAKNDHQRAQISYLEKALKQANYNLEEINVLNETELKKSRETVDELNRKLASFMSTIEAKNMEIRNLQTALGQYYAEIEIKERLAEDLVKAKEELERLTEQLKEAYGQGETLKREKEDAVVELSKAERLVEDRKSRITKLEEDNEKLRRALEQSMTRLNRMSVDSDFHVDRRIVIKLLVTYFQRNHSKEVLDLMARMLGFSDEDKQRIGIAQQRGGPSKGVVRGVFGLPGRLVGGILGGGGSSSSEALSNMASDNQSFADLWVDFLLTETEKRESGVKEDENNGTPNQTTITAPMQNNTFTSNDSSFNRFSESGFSNNNNNRSNALLPQYQNNSQFRSSSFLSEAPVSEFSTISLSSDNVSQASRFLPRYS